MTGDQEPRGLLETLGRLWMAGVTIDWQQFYANERRLRVVLPTYPFERKRYWPDSPIAARTTTSVAQTPVAVAGNGVESSTSALSLSCTKYRGADRAAQPRSSRTFLAKNGCWPLHVH